MTGVKERLARAAVLSAREDTALVRYETLINQIPEKVSDLLAMVQPDFAHMTAARIRKFFASDMGMDVELAVCKIIAATTTEWRRICAARILRERFEKRVAAETGQQELL